MTDKTSRDVVEGRYNKDLEHINFLEIYSFRT